MNTIKVDKYTDRKSGFEEVCCGIVTYNPQLERLRDCITSVSNQVYEIIIFDNGSRNIDDIKNEVLQYKNVKIVSNEVNLGIATALSRIMNYAYEHDYDWVISLDQDSVLKEGSVRKYLEYSRQLQHVGMLTCLIKDRNFIDEKNENQQSPVVEVEYCITSGAFTSVEAYMSTPGYDESFFIDYVDFDLCYSLKERKYKIYRINHVGILHEVGKGENRKILWKTIVVYHEKPWRFYYIARNIRKMGKKHRVLFPFYRVAKKEITLLARIILFEDDKISKLKYFFKGIFAYLP